MPKDDGLDTSLLGSEMAPEVLSFYGGAITLFYDDWLHAYWREGENGEKIIVPGSTTIGSTLDKSGPLTQWAANMVIEMIMTEYPMDDELRSTLTKCYRAVKEKGTLPVGGDQSLPSLSLENFAALLQKARFNFKAIKETAGDIGGVAHEWLETWVKAQIAGEITDNPEYPQSDCSAWFALHPYPHNDPAVVEKLGPDGAQKATNAVMAALSWFEKHKVRFVASERKLYSRKYDYAGTADLFMYVVGCGDDNCCEHEGELFVNGDFKTSKGLWDTYFLQLASYVQAWGEEFPDQPLQARLLIRLDKETGEFETAWRMDEHQEGDIEAFLGLLDAYIWTKQLEIDRRYEKKEARDGKKAAKEQEKADKRAAKAQAKAEKEALKASRPKRERAGKRLVGRGAAKAVVAADEEIPVAAIGDTAHKDTPPWDKSIPMQAAKKTKPKREDDDVIEIKPIITPHTPPTTTFIN